MVYCVKVQISVYNRKKLDASKIEKMAQFLLFCLEVMSGRFFGVYLYGDPLDDLEARLLQGLEFFWIVGKDADLAKPEIEQYFSALLVFAGINLET